MEKELITLCEKNQEQKLIDTLKDVPSDKISSLLDHRIKRGRDPVPLVKACFMGLSDSASRTRERRQDLFVQCVKLLQTNDVTSKHSIDLLGQLMLEVDSLQGVFLAELAEMYVDWIKTKANDNGKYLELLPKILSALSEQENVPFRGGEMKGSDCKNHVINALCSVRWNSDNSVLALVAMFRDVTLSADQLKFVMEKVLRMFRDVSLDELPPLIFQLLLLANKGHKDLLLEGIISYFTELDSNQRKETNSEDMYSELSTDRSSREMVLQTEGTVTLHVTFAAGQDRQLAREFLKYLKTTCANQLVAPFTFSLLLCISKIDHCEEPIFDLLKKCLVTSYKDADKRRDSFWVRDLGGTGGHDVNVTQAVMAAVRQSTCVWDYVVQGLVKLGFVLMTSYGPRATFGRLPERRTGQRTSGQAACDLGAQILAETFKIHSMARDEILDRLLNKIMIGQEGGCISHFMDLLTTTILTTPHHFFDSVQKIREILDTVPRLPLRAAHGVLRALPPLLKISRHLKDSLLIVLRKSLFSRQMETRLVAVNGYLVLLKHFRILGGSLSLSQASQSSFSGSQLSVDIHKASTSTAVGNEGLCLEILNALRRALVHNSQVRQTLYQGLYDVISRNTQLLEPVLEFLTSQLYRYYDVDVDVVAPLKLSGCLAQQGENVSLNEPLDILLHTIQLCLQQYKADPEQGKLSVAEKLQTTYQDLTRRMLKVEMEDFELDKSADYSASTSVGQRNKMLAQLVMGVYEALLEYQLMYRQHSVETLEIVGKLFDQYKTLSDVIKEKTTQNNNGKKGRPAQPSNKCNGIKSLLSLPCLQSILEHLFAEKSDVDSPWSTLRRDDDFVRYVMTSSSQTLRRLAERDDGDADRQTMKRRFSAVASICRCLLEEVTSCLREGGRRKFVSQHLECFGQGLDYVCSYVAPRFDEFLEILDDDARTATDSQAKLFVIVKRVKNLLTTVLSGEERSLKDCQTLVTIFERLARHLAPGTEHYDQVLEWLESVCRKENIEDVNASRCLLNLLLTMTSRVKNGLCIVREVCEDLHAIHGDIDQEVSMEETSNFCLVNARTANSILMLILSRIEQELDDVEWVVNKMKLDLAACTEKTKQDSTQETATRDGRERSVCLRLGSLINAFHQLVQTALPLGQACDTLIRQLHKLYTALTNLNKYYLFTYSKSMGALLPKFEKLVKLTGVHLTQHVYASITYMQASQVERLQNVEQKKKGDKKKTDQPVKKAHVLKEGKAVPALIFSIEEYEKFLIQLSKKSKINLMEHMKNSTNRDFRINTAALQAMEEENSDSGSDRENREPPAEGNATINQSNIEPTPRNDEPAVKKVKLMPKKSRKRAAKE